MWENTGEGENRRLILKYDETMTEVKERRIVDPSERGNANGKKRQEVVSENIAFNFLSV